MSTIPHLGFAAFSGTGKTTLLRKLINHFNVNGVRVAVIKHAHHNFDTDVPGKDSYELRKAGASELIISSGRRRVHFHEIANDENEASLETLLTLPDPTRIDLILVEGFKRASIPKIELHRPSLGQPLLATDDVDIIAVAADERLTPPRRLPWLDLNDVESIATFIRTRLTQC
ncbi:MAG: molybdopterin-guanine dinucleotide biosynthesis protein B [Pseudomonadota bacterium]